MREITFTFDIEGQDGRLLWGKSWSNPERKEPFVASIAFDGRTDHRRRYGRLADHAPCRPGPHGPLLYHPATGPSQSMVASCGTMQRAR